jgi:hypothetical protein
VSIEDLARRYRSGESIPEIATVTGIPASTVRLRLIAIGERLRSRAEGVRLASEKLSRARRGKKRKPFTVEHRENIARARVGRGAGISLKRSGYLEITTGPDKGRGAHVVVMEQAIGRRIQRHEVVHHVDGNRANNDLSNLRLMTRSAHTALHRRQRHVR